jgi:hypothetical protein
MHADNFKNKWPQRAQRNGRHIAPVFFCAQTIAANPEFLCRIAHPIDYLEACWSPPHNAGLQTGF